MIRPSAQANVAIWLMLDSLCQPSESPVEAPDPVDDDEDEDLLTYEAYAVDEEDDNA